MPMTLQEFPGGQAGFELILRYCYNNNNNVVIQITHSNVVFLNHVSKYMEMNKNVFRRPNDLIEKTEKFLERIDWWTWSELLMALKQGHNMLEYINSVSTVHKLVDEVVERLAFPCLTTPSFSSSKCSSFRSSCDSKNTTNTQSSKSCCFRRFWWFEDLSTFDIDLIEMLVKKMVLEKFDHCSISKFLFYYQRVRILGVSKDEIRGEIVQKLIKLLAILDKSKIPIKGLFETLRVSSNLKLRISYKSRLELLIGSQLDQAALDDLLLPSPKIGRKAKTHTNYNVNIVLRFLKNFLLEGNLGHKLCSYRLKRVARLVDLYACEIAPDARLKPSKFIALIRVVPPLARDSYDKLYQAVEIYLQVHPRLEEEQKRKLCSLLNYNKLTPQILDQLLRNQSFPLIAIVKALVHSNPSLKSFTNGVQYLNVFKKSRYNNNGYETKDEDKVFMKALGRNEKLRAHLQEMGWTMLELDKIFGEILLQAQKSTNGMTSKVCCVHTCIKNLPKLCS